MTIPTMGDTDLEELMAGLASCLCRVLVEAGRPACCCMWYQGDNRPPMDRCDCECPPDQDGQVHPGQGVAWVREVQRDNVATPAQPRRGFGADCTVPNARWRLTLEMGVYRCVPTGDPEEGPTCQERTNAAADGAWDAALLEYALRCCDVLDGRQVTITTARPVGPVGGCAGRTLTFTANYHPSTKAAPRPPAPATPATG